MGWFNKEDLKSQYKHAIDHIIKDLDSQFNAGFTYGKEEYAGSWQGKDWKDELENFVKRLQKYDNISFVADAKNFGIALGKLDAMLSTDLAYTIVDDDKGTELLIHIITELRKLKNFDVKILKKKFDRIKLKKLSEQGIKNHHNLILTLQEKY